MKPPHLNYLPTATEWNKLKQVLLKRWETDLHKAWEEELRSDPTQTLLYLPHPYSSSGGNEATSSVMYAWDTYFINLAMMKHGQLDRVRDHILNQLFMIERYGFVLGGNRSFLTGHSQLPLHADIIQAYFRMTFDEELARYAYPLLKAELLDYWCAPHHLTDAGLHTNRDITEETCSVLDKEQAVPTTVAMLAETETGLDFCPNFDGDVRQFLPLITNCVLVRYLESMEFLATLLLNPDKALWREMRGSRSELIREYCWDSRNGFFFEYNHITERVNSIYTLCGYLPMWAGIVTNSEAQQMVQHLPKFRQPFGLSQTDQNYPSPHSQLKNVQWNYPAGWPPFQILIPQALRKYGFIQEALSCDRAWLSGCFKIYSETGKFFQKYNVVDGSLSLPGERCAQLPEMNGWSTASCLLAGLELFPS